MALLHHARGHDRVNFNFREHALACWAAGRNRPARHTRLVHVGDRENDIYEFFCAACELGTHFLVRTCVDRLALDGQCTVATVMTAAPLAGTHGVEVTADDGTAHTVELELRFVRVRVLPPIGKQKRYPALDLTILHARETAELEAVPGSSGSSQPICPSPRSTRRLGCCGGMRAGGRSNCSTRS